MFFFKGACSSSVISESIFITENIKKDTYLAISRASSTPPTHRAKPAAKTGVWLIQNPTESQKPLNL
jgi:hypothetical protein